jgi:hypothetical protein
VRVGFVANPVFNKPPQFEPPKTLPAVPAVAPCNSPLVSGPLSDYHIGPTTSAPFRNLPPPVSESLLTLLLGAAAAGVVLRQIGLRP